MKREIIVTAHPYFLNFPAVNVFSGPTYGEELTSRLPHTVASIWGYVYCGDFDALYDALAAGSSIQRSQQSWPTGPWKGLDSRLIIDYGKLVSGTCVSQNEKLAKVLHLGVQVRVMRPHRAITAAMHSKTLILDCALAYLGSCNPSWNGVNRNTEDVVRTIEVSAVMELILMFLQRWDAATPLDPQYLEHLA